MKVWSSHVINVNWCRPRLPRGPLSFPAQTAKTAKVTGNTASFAVCITKWCRRWAAECSNDDDYLVIRERGRCVGLNFQFIDTSHILTVILHHSLTPVAETRKAALPFELEHGNTSTHRKYVIWLALNIELTSCAGGRHNMPPPLASWPLTFWPWKSCPSHVWLGIPLC